MKHLAIVVGLLVPTIGFSQLEVNAGIDIHRCSPEVSIPIGENVTVNKGTPPYTYEWSIEPIEFFSTVKPYLHASDVLSDTTVANPISTYAVGDSIAFYLKVTDVNGYVGLDTIDLTTSHFDVHLTYWTLDIKSGDSIYLNFVPNIGGGYRNSATYLWQPTHGLSDSTLPQGFWAKPNKSISYHAVVTDSKGCSVTGSDFYSINVSDAVGVQNLNDDNLRIFPNPCKNSVFVDGIDNSQIEKVEIYSINGRLEFTSETIINNRLDFSQLSSGTYTLNIKTSFGEYSSKIIKE